MDQFLGEIRVFSGNYAPRDWAFCNGQLLPVKNNQGLFALLGNRWGGDGVTTFALPNLQERLLVGSGLGPGLTERKLGDSSGVSKAFLKEEHLPAHTHDLAATDKDATSDTPAHDKALFAAAFSPDADVKNVGLPYLKDTTYVDTVDKKTKIRQPYKLAVDTVTEEGSSSPHNNEMPALSLNYIIALTGVFPTE